MNQQYKADARHCYVKEGRREGGDKEKKKVGVKQLYKCCREINNM